jgi:Lipocalin-like domain
MRLLSTSALAAIVAFGTTIAGSAPSEAQETMAKEKLVGPWQLASFKATAGDKVSYPLGEHPGGYIEITPTRYWVMLVDPTRKAPAAATLTDAESVSLMKSHVAYTGKYDVDAAQTPDGIKITIHVDAASNQALTGTNRVLYARVDGKKMTVKSPTLVVGTSGITSVVELEYVKAE